MNPNLRRLPQSDQQEKRAMNEANKQLANYGYDKAAENGKREREVPGQLDQLAHSVDALADVAQRMVDRLTPVSQQNAPAGISPNAVPEAVLCDVASQIRDAQQRVRRYTVQLEQALNRLEV